MPIVATWQFTSNTTEQMFWLRTIEDTDHFALDSSERLQAIRTFDSIAKGRSFNG